MRMVSYNVRYFGHGTRGIASTQGGMRRIAQAIVKLDPMPDVVMLQEVETTSIRSNALHWTGGVRQIDVFADILAAEILHQRHTRDAYTAHYFPAHVYGPKVKPVYTTGLATLVRQSVPVVEAKAQDITQREGYLFPSFKQTRLCAKVRVAHPELGEVDFFNTHLSLPQAFTKRFWQQKDKMGHGENQLAEIEALLKFVSSEKGAGGFVLAGDFNAGPGSPVVERMRQEGLRHGLESAHGLDEHALRGFPTAGFMHLRMHIDHAFTSAGLAFDHFDETFAFGRGHGPFHGLSDHMPLIGKLVRG